MKLRVIGSSSAYPTKDNPTSGYLLEGRDGTKVLLDIGSGVLMKLKGFMELDEIDNIFITHMHYDHSADAGVAIYDRLVMKDLGRTKEDLHFHTPLSEKAGELESPASTVDYIDEDTHIAIGSMEFSFLKTSHSENCHAIKVVEGDGSLVYTGDTKYFDELAEFSQGVNLLLAECSMERKYEAGKYGHMGTDEVAELGSNARPDILALVHTPSYTPEETILSEVEENYEASFRSLKTLEINSQEMINKLKYPNLAGYDADPITAYVTTLRIKNGLKVNSYITEDFEPAQEQNVDGYVIYVEKANL